MLFAALKFGGARNDPCGDVLTFEKIDLWKG